MLASTIAAALLLALHALGAALGLPDWLRWTGSVGVFGLLPGWLLARVCLPRLSAARLLGLGIALSPILVAILGLVVGWSSLGATMAVLEALGLIALAVRDRRRAFGADRALWITLIGGIAVTLVVMWPNLTSLRARAGTHGLLHAAIVESITQRGVPPENPYFAGETVRYYWFYHLSVAPFTGEDDPLLAFTLSNAVLLLGILLILHELASSLFRRASAGPWAAALGFLALNPFGWIVFLLSERTDTLEQVRELEPPFFFYRWLAAGWDDRVTATLTKFLNVSSNQATVAAGLALLYLAVRTVQAGTGNRRGPLVLAGLATFACCVFEPLVALGVVIPVGGGLAATMMLDWRRQEWSPLRRAFAMLLAIGAGGLVSLIALWPWLGAALDESDPALATAGPARHLIGLLATSGPWLLVAAWAAWPGLRQKRADIWLMTVSTLALAAMALGLQAAEDCEYKFLRMLIFPVGVLAAERIAAGWERGIGWKIALGIGLAGMLLPTNAIAWAGVHAFAQGEPVFDWTDEGFVRRPVDGPLSQVHQWIRRETPEDAIVLDDPIFFPSSVAGRLHHNEVPIFTRRALFTDEKYYLNDRYEDLELRLELCRKLFRVDGQLTSEQIQYLRDLERPIVLLLRERYVADPSAEQPKRFGYDPQMPAALKYQGIFLPAFRSGGTLVYRLAEEGRR